MSDKHLDKSMARVKALFQESGLSLHDLGLKMGYPPEGARQSAFQFMKAGDPRISMLRKFAGALDMTIEDLLTGKKRNQLK
jgi:transcriptional regulator with XRE-family HTH domain